MLANLHTLIRRFDRWADIVRNSGAELE